MSDLYSSFLTGDGRTRPVDRWHHYFPIYEQWLAGYRGTECLFVEIGVQAGGSLQMWRHWLGPNARIAGIDIDPQCAPLGAAADASVFIGDQADAAFLRRVLAEIGSPDVVIDDGGHFAGGMIGSFETLYPAMRPDGIYLAEDTHVAFWPQHIDRPGQTFMQFAVDRMVELHHWTARPEAFELLSLPPERRPEIAAPEFCRTTRAVHFYDSVVVFEREARNPPQREVR